MVSSYRIFFDLILSVLFMQLQEREWDSAISSSSHRSLSSLERICHSQRKCPELMRYFSSAKGSSRNLTGNLRSRCTAIWLSCLAEHEFSYGIQKRWGLRWLAESVPLTLFLYWKLNYPQDTRDVSSRCGGSRLVLGKREWLGSLFTTDDRIVMSFMFRSYK